MDEDGPDLYLSDVHIHTKHTSLSSAKRSVSRFQFKLDTTFDDHSDRLSNNKECINDDQLGQGHNNEQTDVCIEHSPTGLKKQTDVYIEHSPTGLKRKCCTDEDEDIFLVKRKKKERPPDAALLDLRTNQYDEDGDLIVQRQSQSIFDENVYTLTLEHSLATELGDVGEQVWRGALILADYLIHKHKQIKDSVVLDLGAGTALTSIVATLFCKKVYCTDIGKNILDIALHNLEMNSDVIDMKDKNNFVVRELDWFKDEIKSGNGDYCFTDEEIEEIKKADILMAADVVYDEDKTEAFFRTVHKLMSERPAKMLYISLEKRYVFTLADLDVTTPAYNHFLGCLGDLHLLNDNGLKYSYKKVDMDFPQYLNYTRTKELAENFSANPHNQSPKLLCQEIWKITSTFPS